uniref:Uncharacterized protein n=1 Tax=Marseillevirus LCMAC201 TaxID=2506605 RepID=A0A481YYC2_9VIRU|nr:MAG: hypothetical protein LCMAC201_04550 [Marseillevirus LCMAC201]
MDYIKSFVIGSSVLIVLPFYIAVMIIPERTFSLETYPIKVALYFGFMNILALLLGKLFNISLFKRLLLISFISVAIILGAITCNRAYIFESRKRWWLQYLLVVAGHFFTYLVIIYYLEKYVF